jgi:endonuclease/exonuclease/phosphatase family metal-dependent hydrolase
MLNSIKVFAGTYNCNQRAADKLDLSNWTNHQIDHDNIDLYIWSFQELTTVNNVPVQNAPPTPVDLTNFQIWNDGTLDYINQQRKHSKVEKLWDGQLGGTMFAAFVREGFKKQFHNVQAMAVECSRSKTTIKGAICIRFDYNGTSFVFASAHLTADQDEDNYELRIRDFNHISQAKFKEGATFDEHDFICWTGDLNFRVNADRHVIAQLSEEKKFEEILQHDQLRIAQLGKLAFTDYLEGPITFAPTYKYIRGTNQFCLTEPPGKRSPAYTDRVVYKFNSNKVQVTVDHYSMGALLASDHKPINALLTISIKGN